MVAKGLAGSSITRVFGTVRSVFNFSAAEIGITVTNPFAGVYCDRQAGVEDRQPLSLETIKSLQSLCRDEDDDLRWLVALVSDTGMRPAEAAGLLVEDIRLESPTPHVVVQEHLWRRLKTKCSSRAIPLVGASLWAAERIVAEVRDSKFAFPRYNKNDATNANSASAALNKWIKQHAPKESTMHSFRHSMRDRLRAVECPADIVDQLVPLDWVSPLQLPLVLLKGDLKRVPVTGMELQPPGTTFTKIIKSVEPGHGQLKRLYMDIGHRLEMIWFEPDFSPPSTQTNSFQTGLAEPQRVQARARMSS